MNNDNEIDLHGMDLNEATMAVTSFLYTKFHMDKVSKLYIITGKGQVLREQTIQIIEEEKLRWDFCPNNSGKIIVYSS